MKTFKQKIEEDYKSDNMVGRLCQAHMREFTKNKKLVWWFDDSIKKPKKQVILKTLHIYYELTDDGGCKGYWQSY
jgi:hypothetical protein